MTKVQLVVCIEPGRFIRIIDGEHFRMLCHRKLVIFSLPLDSLQQSSVHTVAALLGISPNVFTKLDGDLLWIIAILKS